MTAVAAGLDAPCLDSDSDSVVMRQVPRRQVKAGGAGKAAASAVRMLLVVPGDEAGRLWDDDIRCVGA